MSKLKIMSKNVWKWNKLIIIGLDREEEKSISYD